MVIMSCFWAMKHSYLAGTIGKDQAHAKAQIDDALTTSILRFPMLMWIILMPLSASSHLAFSLCNPFFLETSNEAMDLDIVASRQGKYIYTCTALWKKMMRIFQSKGFLSANVH